MFDRRQILRLFEALDAELGKVGVTGDALHLIRLLGLKTPGEVFAIIAKYYPERMVPSKSRFLVEELLA